MRRTKIVATVGPACGQEKILKALIQAGADVLRINTSHTSPQGLREWIRFIRKVSRTLKKDVAILVDLQGPRVRTGPLKEGKSILLKKRKIVSIILGSGVGGSNGLSQINTPCQQFPKMVKKGDRVLIDNGLIELRVLRVGKKQVQCRVINGDLLGENKGINLPNAPVTLPALGKKDRDALKIAVKFGVDYVALSFVRTREDIQTVKKWLSRYGKQIPVIAKIEKPRAVDQIDSIMDVSDGIMVARGDLGIEMGVEKVPVVQKQLIEKAREKNIPVITATQMLESMIEHPRPTRAEASDIANAVFDGTDAVMLSGETSIGKHPIEAVRFMSEIILEAERHKGIFAGPDSKKICQRPDHPLCAITRAAQNAAHDLAAKAIVAFTMNGKTALLISKFGSEIPILALTPSEQVSRRLHLIRGVFPLKIDYSNSTDQMILRGEQTILGSKFLKRGDSVVIVSGQQELPGARYMVKIHKLGVSL